MKSNEGYSRKKITTKSLNCLAVSFPLLWNQIFKIFFIDIIFYLLFFFYSLPLFFLIALTLLVHFSVPDSLIPFINNQGSGHENQTFTKTTTISGMSQRFLCVCVVVVGGVSVCVAQLLSRWNAHYAADDNSVESKVCASLCLLFPLSLVNSILTPSYLSSSVCPGSHLHLSPSLSLFFQLTLLLCFVLTD